MGVTEMWNESTVQAFYTDHRRGGVAPSRHEIARQAYVGKIRARHEAERRAATTGAVTKAVSRLWAPTRAMFARPRSSEAPTRRTGAAYPAE
jgi:hypothetical protein